MELDYNAMMFYVDALVMEVWNLREVCTDRLVRCEFLSSIFNNITDTYVKVR